MRYSGVIKHPHFNLINHHNGVIQLDYLPVVQVVSSDAKHGMT